MSKVFRTNLNLSGSQLIAAAHWPLSTAPSSNLVAGQLYYNTTGSSLNFYNGTAWVQLATGSTALASLNGLVVATTLQGTTNQITVTTSSPNITLSFPTAGVTLPGKTTLTASTTGGSALNIPSGVDPTTPASGDFWNASGILKLYNGSATKTVAFTDSAITGFTGTLAIANGGTGTTTAPTQYGLIYAASGTAYASTAAGTNTQVLLGNASGAPTWTNISGLSVSSATTATNATNSAITEDTATSSTVYPTWVTANTGNLPLKTTSTKLSFVPSTGVLSATKITLSGIPTNPTDAATKSYVDQIASGVNAHDAVKYATSGALGTTNNLVGGTITTTYNNFAVVLSASGTIANAVGTDANITGLSSTTSFYVGQEVRATFGTGNFGGGTATVAGIISSTSISVTSTANFVAGTITNITGAGVGSTLTIATSSNWTAITIDGQSLTVNDRVLIKDQASALQNGVYTVTSVGAVANTTSFVFTRATDMDMLPEFSQGDLVYVVSGTANGGQGWIITSAITSIGSSNVTWSQFSGASDITAGAGLTRSGNIFAVGTASTARIVVNTDNIDLATTAVTANPYGSASAVPSFTVDAYGRLTAASSSAYQDATTSVKGVASFNTASFAVTSGDVTIKAGGISAAQLAITPTLKSVGTVTGDGTTTAFTFTHALGRDITCQVYQTSAGPDTQYDEVEVDINRLSATQTRVTFGVAPSNTTTYSVVMIG